MDVFCWFPSQLVRVLGAPRPRRPMVNTLFYGATLGLCSPPTHRASRVPPNAHGPPCISPHRGPAGPLFLHVLRVESPPPPLPTPRARRLSKGPCPNLLCAAQWPLPGPARGPLPLCALPHARPLHTHTLLLRPAWAGPRKAIGPTCSPPHTYLHEAKTQQNILVHSNAIWDGTRCVASMLNVRNIWHGIYGHSMLLNGL